MRDIKKKIGEELMPTSPDHPGPSIRFAVLKDAARCQVLLSGLGDNGMQLEISGDPLLSEQVRSALAAIEPQGGVGQSLEQKLQSVAQVASDMLRDQGLEIKALPPGDISFRFEFDIKSGQAVSQGEVLHEHAVMPADLGRRIHESLVGAFRKKATELAAEVERLTDAGNHPAAAQALEDGWQEASFHGDFEHSLLDALLKIEVQPLSVTARESVRKYRVAVATQLERYNDAEVDATEMLKENTGLPPDLRTAFENLSAIAAAKRGQNETALSIWRRLLRTPEAIHPGERGWIWRNVSHTLPITDPEVPKAARLSADAFLEAGDKKAAIGSLMRLSTALEYQNAAAALAQLDAMLALISDKGLISAELTATIYHVKANRLRETRSHAQALEAALKAVALRRTLIGVDDQLLSSIHLARMEAANSGNAILAAELDTEAKTLEARTSNQQFAIGRRAEALFQNFDEDLANILVNEARTNGNPEVIGAVEVAVTVSDPELGTTERLRKLETVLHKLTRIGATRVAIEPVYLAIAQVLSSDGQFTRAASWLRKLVEVSPLSLDARDHLIEALWKSEAWGSAAIYLGELIEKNGDAPGLLYAYGRSLLEAGDASGAVTALHRCMSLSTDQENVHQQARELRERALDLGGTISPQGKPSKKEGAVLREEIEQALSDFARFIASEKRMGFWKKQDDGEYAWVHHPEQRAQDLLHTFLQARFQHRLSVFEEVDTGAGRLDLLLKVEGGLSVIIELKMCGFSYSSSYAAAGEGQIRHYMENRSARLGYLVVHDARLDKYGSSLIAGSDSGANSIFEVFVDVRPRVSERKKAATASSGTS